MPARMCLIFSLSMASRQVPHPREDQTPGQASQKERGKCDSRNPDLNQNPRPVPQDEPGNPCHNDL